MHAGGGDRLGSMETMHVVQQIKVSPELIVLVTSEVQQKHNNIIHCCIVMDIQSSLNTTTACSS